MTKIYLIRHAEAEGNLYRRIHGHYDSIVTDNGYKQIEALVERMDLISIDAIYSSDLFRARKTAEAICDLKNIPLRENCALREISLGVWEDKPFGQIGAEEEENLQLFSHSSPRWKVKNGETFEELRIRISREILSIAEKHPDESVVIVTHGTAIRYVCAVFSGLSVEESSKLGHSDNTAVTLLEVESGSGKVQIRFSDDNSHLNNEISTLAQQGWWKRQDGVKLDENLWYQPFDLSQMPYRGLYLASRQEAWMDLGRDMRHFGKQGYMDQAIANYKASKGNLVCAQNKITFVGILQMDPEKEKEDNAGFISFFYMLPEFRGQGLGVQMIGQAVSRYRPMGRDKLRLICGEDNLAAKTFYMRYGFRIIETREEAFGTVHLMEKYIGFQ